MGKLPLEPCEEGSASTKTNPNKAKKMFFFAGVLIPA